VRAALAVILAGGLAAVAHGQSRFPRPQFESGYVTPTPSTPQPRLSFLDGVDVAVLFGTLSLVTYLALVRRSRRELFLAGLFSLLYFGFWRKGCICPVGSMQNVVLAVVDPGYALPFGVIAFFTLPLVFSLFFGRVFCAAVCPLGAVQDVFILRPVRLPQWLKHSLWLLPVLYLGATLIYTAAGSRFLTCRFDPFVGFFRLSGPAHMLITGAILIVLGVFVARPYCRFLCPYGVLLRGASRLAWKHLTITPEECVDCRLCRDSCPFDAIRFPAADPSAADRRREMRRVASALVALPVMVLLVAWAAGRLGPTLAGAQREVRVARELLAAQAPPQAQPSADLQFAQEGGVAGAALIDSAAAAERRFVLWSRWVGGGVALLVMLKLVRLSLYRRIADHEPDRGECFSCGRCFEYCPIHRRREEEIVSGRVGRRLETGHRVSDT
jgi:ferredoxin